MNYYEVKLLNLVKYELNSGKTKITIPSKLITSVSNELLQEINRLCKLNNVAISIIA